MTDYCTTYDKHSPWDAALVYVASKDMRMVDFQKILIFALGSKRLNQTLYRR